MRMRVTTDKMTEGEKKTKMPVRLEAMTVLGAYLQNPNHRWVRATLPSLERFERNEGFLVNGREENRGPTKIIAKSKRGIMHSVAVALNENWISTAEQKKGATCCSQKLKNVLS